MAHKRILFYVYCVLLWPAGAFVNGQMSPYAALLLWWMASQFGATHATYRVFQLHAWFPITMLDGFLLGLIPREQLRLAVRAVLARFRSSKPPPSETQPEWSAGRPVLWAWVLPATLFLLRFVTLDVHRNHSVLGAESAGPGRWDHFFGTPTVMAFTLNYMSWFYDRLLITGPMLFLMAYPAAVWVRSRSRLPWHEDNEERLTTDTLGT